MHTVSLGSVRSLGLNPEKNPNLFRPQFAVYFNLSGYPKNLVTDLILDRWTVQYEFQ